ncbi:MAG TPA: hypothetical protein VGZ23_00460 [bacterium]|nr:hypothetical protein [bacterium]
MMRLRVLAAFAVLACGLGFWPRAASAATAGQFELKINYWPANSSWTFNPGGVSGAWNSQFLGGDFRWTSNSGWGIHLKYDTGPESAWSGYFQTGVGTTSGQDTIWSGDVFYAWQLSTATLRGFVGYGHIEFSDTDPIFGNVDITATGYRLGADVTIPISGTGFSFNANAAWYPSNSEAFSDRFVSSSGSGTALDYGASFQYTWTSGWLVEAGYRWAHSDTSRLVGTGCPCTLLSSGPVLTVGYHW